MSKATKAVKKDAPGTITADIKKGIEHHKTAAAHLTEAAKQHLLAVQHASDGNHDKASTSTLLAQGHTSLAREAQKNNQQHQALTAKP